MVILNESFRDLPKDKGTYSLFSSDRAASWQQLYYNDTKDHWIWQAWQLQKPNSNLIFMRLKITVIIDSDEKSERKIQLTV